LSSHHLQGRPDGLFPSVFPTKSLYVFLIFPMRATSLAHLAVFDLIIKIIFYEEYIRISPVCCHFISLGPTHSPQHLFSKPSVCVLSWC
jgi:hypothetical protein